MSTERSLSELKAKALEAMELLTATIDQLAEIAKSVPDSDAKTAQLKEISRSIQQLEKRNVAVPDALRHLRTSLISELGPVEEAKEGILEIAKPVRAIAGHLEALGLRTVTQRKRRRTRSSAPTTSYSALRQLIVEFLRAHGGRAQAQDVLDWIEQNHEDQFLPGDLETSEMGGRGTVWRHRTHSERSRMVREGAY